MSATGLESIDHIVHLTALADRFQSSVTLMTSKTQRPKTPPALAISPEKVFFIIVKAREFDAKDVLTDPQDSSNATDDAMISVLEDHKDDPVVSELTQFINALTVDEQVDLVALTWLGRGDGTLDDWREIRAEAARAHNRRTAHYLLGNPELSDHLEEALSLFGHSCEEFEMGRL